jgi:hypothetical protein
MAAAAKLALVRERHLDVFGSSIEAGADFPSEEARNA